MSGLFVTFQYGNIHKIVEIVKYSSAEHLEYFDYVFSALQDTNIQMNNFDCFLNVHGAVIEENIFIRYMEQFISHPCACFALKIKTKLITDLDKKTLPSTDNLANLNTENVETIEMANEYPRSSNIGELKRSNAVIGLNLIVTSESIKIYVSKKTGGSKILSDFQETGCLKDSFRRKVVSYLAAFIHENFGFKPTKQEQLAVAEACIKLFPCLKLELLINSSNSGFLQTKLKNERVKKRKIEHEFETKDGEPMEIQQTDPETVLRDLYLLKSASLPEEIPLAKEKLQTTLEYRKKEIQNETFSIYDNCRYFFVCPELIKYDFTLRHGTTPTLSVEWEFYQYHIFSIVKNSGKNVLYTETERNIDWDTQTLSFFNLLRLLPPSPAGRVKFSRMTDEQAVNKIIIHKLGGLTNKEYLCQPINSAPYIIAVGKTKAEIEQYIIAIDGNLIPLLESTFVDALDIVFKLHYLFDIKYEYSLRLFWSFLQKYVYKIDLINTPVTVQDIHEKFIKLSADAGK